MATSLATQTLLPRPRLHRMLDSAVRHRLVCLVAGPGFGKSSLLAMWTAQRPVAWHSLTVADRDLGTLAGRLAHALSGPEFGARFALGDGLWRWRGPDPDSASRAQALAAQLCEAMRSVGDNRLLVLDDIETIPMGTPSAALIEAVCREAPPGVTIVVAGRQDPPFRVARLRAYGYMGELTAMDLAFTEGEVAQLLSDVAGSPAHAGAVLETTSGWPVAVRLVAEALRGATETDVRRLLAATAQVGGPLFDLLAHEVFAREPADVRELIKLTASLGRVSPSLLACGGGHDSAIAIADLARRGLFAEARPPGSGVYALIPLARDFVRRHYPMADDARDSAHRQAAQWYAVHGDPVAAIDALLGIGDVAGVVKLLTAHGDELLASGAVTLVARALAAIPPSTRDGTLWRLAGEAAQIVGAWDTAAACFGRAAGDGPLRAGMAWRLGLIHYLQGEPGAARAVYDRAVSGLDEPREEAQLAAWSAAARWAAGDLDGCRALAERSLEQAILAADDRALAAAHAAWCLVSVLAGDRGGNDTHYHQALTHAERAGDTLQLVRLRTNRASHLMEEADYPAALAELAHAIPLAQASGFATFHALALHNRGDTYRCLERLAEAVADLTEARGLYQRLGSKHVCRPLRALGDVYRARGDHALSRASYEEAISAAEQCGEVRTVVLALSGLSILEAKSDPVLAQAAVTRAMAEATGPTRITALLAAGRVAIARGDLVLARDRADEVMRAARTHRDRAALTAASELIDETEQAPGRQAEPADCPPVAVRTLGGFQVLHAGEPVPAAAWQSRKARDLVKLLVSRRGRPVPRTALMDALWPGEAPARLSNRMSVALSTARGVLDPQRLFPPHHLLIAEDGAVRLDVERLPVDVCQFLAEAQQGLTRRQRPLLQRAQARFAGDFLEGDSDDEWAEQLRIEARAVYVQVCRALAEAALAEGDTDAAIRHLLSILERDRFDERAHLALIESLELAGDHGEARRRYRDYSARMSELDAEPAPFPLG